MKKKRFIIFAAILIILSLAIFLAIIISENTGGVKYSVDEVKEILNNADEIKIKERIIAGNKSYRIFVNDEYIANVTGKYINITGEVLSLTNISGELVAKEKQIKRWGIKLNRLAEMYDNEGNVVGYMGEERLEDLFRVGYYFHFYDKDKNEIGVSDEVVSLLKKDKFYNTDKDEIYTVHKNFNLFTSAYTITIKDSSDVSAEMAIFMTCIEDSIDKAEKEEAKEKEE